MKGKQKLYLPLIAIVLFFSSAFLFVENNYYRNENRKLILENDSIISVNIQLKDTLQKEAGVGSVASDKIKNSYKTPPKN